ncbi:hypothetical protein IE077_003599 [Cardiosporidium cionae]|uniref:alanine--glyoxylate transaminase n=1 Tax=Cardiosporidium cionae TaxID=476202 RepID=A0ABQ7JGK3_9APIC|nr:hypothetical protein IE077_003599 [Cardiosporidium cionae]|eukprot:KAF8823106.1 hypothetical protein IE077_003599 [Cardiosporidium cionae]
MFIDVRLGNPLSCATGRTVLKIIKRDNLQVRKLDNLCMLIACVMLPVLAYAFQRTHFPLLTGEILSISALLGLLLQEHCATLGSYLKSHLQSLQEKSDILGDVRGSGFLIGLEFVENKVTKVPSTEICRKIMERLKDLGFLVGKGGLQGNVLRLAPPMCITKEDADAFLNTFERILFE